MLKCKITTFPSLYCKNIEYKQNSNQSLYKKMLTNDNTKLVIATGPAGTGKTMLPCHISANELCNGRIDKLIITRPIVPVGNDIGFLPGTINDKIEPWVTPIYDYLLDIIDKKTLTNYVNKKKIELCPLCYVRGRTFKNSWIIADEMQNSTKNEMLSLLTRVGENSKIVVTGDMQQSDLMNHDTNGLQNLLQLLESNKVEKKDNMIEQVVFDYNDVKRSEFVKYILQIYQ